MIATFEGVRGAGMTLFGVHFAYQEYLRTGKKPVCKTGVEGPYTTFTEEDFLKEVDERREEEEG